MSTKPFFDWPEPDSDMMLSERIRTWRDRALLAARHAEIAYEAVKAATTALGYKAGEVATHELADHVRNVKALADKLQTLLDSKTHQVEALHAELESARHACEVALGEPMRWQGRAEDAERALGMIAGVLIKHADGDFLVGDPTTLQVAQHIVDKLSNAEPDIDTVPLQALLEAVGTFLEPAQAVTIRGSYQAVGEVDIEAMGLTFRVGTHEASEALTHAQELAQCLLVEVGA